MSSFDPSLSEGAPDVVAIMGSYHRQGVLDAALCEVLEGAKRAGARVRRFDLVDQPIEFCRNCRECCSDPHPVRGRCVIEDGAAEVLDALDAADAVVLGAPVNFGDVNAITRRFQERMLGYTYWPPGQAAPKLRSAGKKRKRPAVLLTSSAAPGLMTRYLARPLSTLRGMARLLGARPLGSLIVGLAAGPGFALSERKRLRARNLGRELATRARQHPAPA